MSGASADGVAPRPPFADGRAQVHLIGFMGVGKSSVGQRLARALVWNFLDLDVLVVRHVGMPIAELFAARGEAAFRDAEAHALRQAVQKPRTVVALGGGAWEAAANRELALRHGVSVWLDCPLEEIRRRLGDDDASRPLWSDPEQVAARFRRRRQDYARAEVRIDAHGAPEDVLARVLAALPD